MVKTDSKKTKKPFLLRLLWGLIIFPIKICISAVGRLIISTLAITLGGFYLPVLAPTVFSWSVPYFAILAWLTISVGLLAIKPGLAIKLNFWRYDTVALLLIISAGMVLALVPYDLSSYTLISLHSSLTDVAVYAPFEIVRTELSSAPWILGVTRTVMVLALAIIIASPVFAWVSVKGFFYGIIYPFKKLLQAKNIREQQLRTDLMRDAAGSASAFHSGRLNLGKSARASDKNRPAADNPLKDFPWRFPSTALLGAAADNLAASAEDLQHSALIEECFRSNGQWAKVSSVAKSPRSTLYRLESVPRKSGTTAAPLQISDDLRSTLKTSNALFEPVVEGAVVRAIQMESEKVHKVYLKNVFLNTEQFGEFKKSAGLPVALGMDDDNNPFCLDLSRVHNFLVNGLHPRERSQFLNLAIVNLLMWRNPCDVRIVTIGPREGSISRLNEVPHLYAPPVNTSGECVAVLKALVKEMRRRLDLVGYNKNTSHEKYFNPRQFSEPYITILFEDLDAILPLLDTSSVNDLMRLAKWGYITGISIIATTGSAGESVVPLALKSELQSRVCFNVASGEESMAVIDSPGGVKLKANGDMLVLPFDTARVRRIQCLEVREAEINNVIKHWATAFAPSLPQLEIESGGIPTASTKIVKVNNRATLSGGDLEVPQAKVASTPQPSTPTPTRPILNYRDVAPREAVASTNGAEPPEMPQLDPSRWNRSQPTITPQSRTPVEHEAPPSPAAREFTVEPETSTSFSRNGGSASTPRANSWTLVSKDVLAPPPKSEVNREELDGISDRIIQCLAEFGVDASIEQVFYGPTATMYGIVPGWKRVAGGREERVKVDHILKLEKDLALSLGTAQIRFEPVVSGESVIGLEVPNETVAEVNMRSIMDSPEWEEFHSSAQLSVPIGLGNGGKPAFTDITKMPHLLIAGATGSGKSVCINTIITGLLLSYTPDYVRMVMVDPKRVELTPYAKIPHLYAPVIVEPPEAVAALKALILEMQDRQVKLQEAGVRDIVAYNERSSERMPYLVIIIDELADLMMGAGPQEVERALIRLSQLGRATGIHLIVATQRPSVNVITGLIKANVPSRISFSVSSQADSRTILDRVGSEKLLGRGDLLFMPIGSSKPKRIQGAFLSDTEMTRVIAHWHSQQYEYLPMLEYEQVDDSPSSGNGNSNSSSSGGDSLFDQAIDLASNQKTLSVSFLQRRLKIGYPRAARLMDELEEAGLVSSGEPGKPRQVIGV